MTCRVPMELFNGKKGEGEVTGSPFLFYLFVVFFLFAQMHNREGKLGRA